MGKVLVTGANGFIGSHLVEALIKHGYQVRALIRKHSNLQWISNLPIEFFYGSISNFDSIKQALDDVEYVMHVAGATKGRNFQDYMIANVEGTKNLIQLCLQHRPNLKKFIHFSTLAVTGGSDRIFDEQIKCQPISYYGITKKIAEELVIEQKDKIPVLILRLSVVYGPRDRESLLYFKFIKKGICPIWENKVAFCYIKDVVCAAINSIERNTLSGSIYNISDGNCYTIEEIANTIQSVMHKKAIKIKLPLNFLNIVAKINALIAPAKSVFGPDKIKELKRPCWACLIQKTVSELGYQPKYSLKEGIEETYQWYLENKWL